MSTPLERSSSSEAGRYGLCWATWPADMTTPVRSHRALQAAGHRPCLLESVEGPARLARYSFIGVAPVARFRGFQGKSTLTIDGASETLAGPCHEALRIVAERHAAPASPPGLPPFCGGWIGWFGYEWVTTLEPKVERPANDPWATPDATFDLFRDLVAFDHSANKIYVLVGCPGGEGDYLEGMRRVESIAAALEGPSVPHAGLRLLDPKPRALTSKADYLAGVASLQQSIREGEIFQAVLSQRFEQRFEGDPFTLYRVLRLTNPAPHMFYFEADGTTLVGSSPERLVSVHGGRAQVVPIAGTRRRADDPDEDDRLGAELRGDPKERAEHDMLVDLARNDLGRVARVGTVVVKEHATLEKFQRVQHLVSRVECDLASGSDAIDALAACFPAGTVSGAPKVRAMQLVAEQEACTRGPYAGCFGYLDGRGNLDMAITIRTLVVKEDTISVQAGAGVVFDSVPIKEYEETLHKAEALIEAVQLAETAAFRSETQSVESEA